MRGARHLVCSVIQSQLGAGVRTLDVAFPVIDERRERVNNAGHAGSVKRTWQTARQTMYQNNRCDRSVCRTPSRPPRLDVRDHRRRR